MLFDWDDANRNHIAKHDVSCEEAECAFLNDPVDLEVQEDDDDVHRYRQIGETESGRVLVFLSTVRDDSVRMISAWDAPKAYKMFYFEEKAKRSWNPPQ